MPVQCTCLACGQTFSAKPSRIANGRGKYCSKACAETPEPLEQRVWRQIDYGGVGCWEWTGFRNAAGYGRITLGTNKDHRGEYVPRLILEMIHGVPPQVACHHCDNPPCCRPSHLYDGTQLSNMQDRSRRGRARWARSRKHVT